LQSLTHEELTAVLTASRARRERDWLAFLLGYWHAMRASEIVNLTRADVDGGFITVRRLKGSRTTVQPLMDHPDPLFNERAAVPVYVRNMQEKQRLFDFNRDNLRRLFRRYAEAVGIPEHKRHPHVLKHTMLSALVNKIGVPATQCWAGHLSGASTLLYTRVDPEDAARAVRAALSPGI
jgi:integrase/recombinase XerD